MLAVLLIDHRVAFLALIALYVTAAIPLAYAWARVLPEERPPFDIKPPADPGVGQKPAPKAASQQRRKIIAIGLLICITTAYLLQFPGFPQTAAYSWALNWLAAVFSVTLATWILYGSEMGLIALIGFAACYAFLNPGPLRFPLTTAAALVLILWLLSPLLRIALIAS
jgi:hypothetical protein